MSWPLSQDYNEAVQNPAQSFADPELRQGEAETNTLGLPAPRSGNFADVYAVVTGQRKWAVKCFTRQIPGLQERYQQISLHLEQVKLPFMVDFTFLERGIRVRGDWYPILKMQWVEGFTLNQFIKNNLDKPQVLEVLCQLWVKLAARLRAANIAHCDLQHGNVLLVPGSKAGALQVKLVDYDGMCVPSLTLLKTIELGHPAYQHPQRQREGIYSLEVDRFSHLVIYTALRALIAGGKALWDKHDDGDNLLFKPSDYQAPTKSLTFYEILKSSSEEGRKLVQVLMQALSGPLDQVPLLESLVALPPKTAVKTAAPAAPAPREAAPAAEAESVFAAATADLVSPTSRSMVRPRRRKRSRLPALLAVVGFLALGAGGAFIALQRQGEARPGPEVAQVKPKKGSATVPTRRGSEPPATSHKVSKQSFTVPPVPSDPVEPPAQVEPPPTVKPPATVKPPPTVEPPSVVQKPPAVRPVKFGKWYYLGPFDNKDWRGFDETHPVETKVDLQAVYAGKDGEKAVWKEGPFIDGMPNDFLPLFKPEHREWAAVYVYRDIDAATPTELPIELGSDDTLSVWLNGEKILGKNGTRTVNEDHSHVTLRLKKGKNHLLLKICNAAGDWGFLFSADDPQAFEAFRIALDGLGSRASLDPLSFGNDWLGFNGKANPRVWQHEGSFARLTTRGCLAYPPIPTANYVFEGELEFLTRETGLRLCLGHPWNAVHLNAYWNQDAQKVRVNLASWHYGTWWLFGGDRDIDVGQRIPFKVVAANGRYALFLNDERTTTLTAWPEDLSLRIWSEHPNSARLPRCSFRALREDDLAGLNGAMPRSKLELDSRAAEARVAALTRGLKHQPEPEKRFVPESTGMPLAWIEAGEFRRSPRDKEPVRQRVRISRGFWMGQCEVTQKEWQALTNANPSRIHGSPYLPVDSITMEEALGFCDKLTEAERKKGRLPAGYEYRLPTEAEWEYACRAGSDEDVRGLPDDCWSAAHSGGHPHEVGEKAPNPWGLHDMLGNALEWCYDDWHNYPAATGKTLVDPVRSGEHGKDGYVVRGGAWWMDADPCRSSWRDRCPSVPGGYRGLRIVLAPALLGLDQK